MSIKSKSLVCFLGLNENHAPPPASPSMDLVAHVADSMPEVTETTDMTEVHTAGDVTFSIEDEDILKQEYIKSIRLSPEQLVSYEQTSMQCRN